MRRTTTALFLACATACGSQSRAPAHPPPPPPVEATAAATPAPGPAATSAATPALDPACERFWAHHDTCWSDESHPKVRIGADQPRTCAMAAPYLACADAACGMPWAQCIVREERPAAAVAAPADGASPRGWFRMTQRDRELVCFGYVDTMAGASAHCAEVHGDERAAVDEVTRFGDIYRLSTMEVHPQPLHAPAPPPPDWAAIYARH